MKLPDQLCSLAQAQQLQALGAPQDSLIWLREYPCTDHDTGQPTVQVFSQLAMWDKLDAHHRYSLVPDRFYAAYNVAELGAMLLDVAGDRFTYRSGASAPDEWWCHQSPRGHSCSGPTEAQARAAMLIYLLQHALVTPAELAARSTAATVDTVQARFRAL